MTQLVDNKNMKILKLSFILATVFLQGCYATAYVGTLAEGRYISYSPIKVPSAFLLENNQLLLCFTGKYKASSGIGDDKGEGDAVLLLPQKPPFSGTHDSKVIDNTCATYINSQSGNQKLPVYTIKKNNTCAYNKYCKTQDWEIYKNNEFVKKGSTKNTGLKKNRRGQLSGGESKEYFNLSIFKHIKNSDKTAAIYAVEEKYGTKKSRKIMKPNGKAFYYEYYLEYHLRKYDLYLVKGEECIELAPEYNHGVLDGDECFEVKLKSIYRDGNPNWHVLTPLAWILDAITSPVQLIYIFNQLGKIGN